LHAAIALDAESGALIGLVHASFHRRAGGQKASCGKRLFADKESRRWLDAIEASGRLAEAGAAATTAVGDAECDIYDVFARRPASVEIVVRAHHDPVLDDETRLFAATEAVAEWGREIIELPANPGRAARTATLALKAGAVTISRPKRNTAAEARRVCAIYRQRWTIEQLFRTMKTKGFDIEAVRVVEPKPFETLAAAILIAAVQVLQMVRERDGAAKRPQSDVFEAEDQLVLEALCTQLQGKTAAASLVLRHVASS
jgi:Transposase DDE domain